MKKIVSVFCATVFAPSMLFGQITTTRVTESTEPIKTAQYDSTRNFLGRDVKGYIGQELYLNGVPNELRGFGYRDFYKEPNDMLVFNTTNIYNCCAPSNKFNSKYEGLAEKYFKVLDVTEYPKSYGKEHILKLQEKTSEIVIYYKYNIQFESSFPFIVVGFFEKLKQHIGQTYIFGEIKQLNHFRDNPDLDMKTGKQIIFEIGKEWKCIDVTVSEKTYNLSMVFEDGAGQTLIAPYDRIVGDKKYHNIFNKVDADKYKAKFGKDTWNMILQGKLKLGMTSQMCILSWGMPNKINETITAGKKTEQWVYPNNYLYFTNGVLTAMQ